MTEIQKTVKNLMEWFQIDVDETNYKTLYNTAQSARDTIHTGRRTGTDQGQLSDLATQGKIAASKLRVRDDRAKPILDADTEKWNLAYAHGSADRTAGRRFHAGISAYYPNPSKPQTTNTNTPPKSSPTSIDASPATRTKTSLISTPDKTIIDGKRVRESYESLKRFLGLL